MTNAGNISYRPTEGLSYDPAEPKYWDPAALQQEVLLGVGFGLLAAMAAVSGAILVTRRIARPIIDLTQTATRITAGDLNQTANIACRSIWCMKAKFYKLSH